MAYNRINWQNGITPINDTNLNIMDLGIYELDQNKQNKLIGSGADQNIKTINNIDVMGTGNISVQPVLVGSGADQNIKTINNIDVMGTGNININQIVGDALSIQTEAINCGSFPANFEKYDQEYSVTIPSGYMCLGIVGWYLEGPGYTNLFTNKLYYNNNKIYWSLKNGATIALEIAISLYVKLLVVKTS